MSKLLQNAGLLALIVFAFNGAWQFTVAEVEPAAAKPRLWEYIGMTRSNVEREKLADKGWELVDVENDVLWFKRPK
jgi:hypothetical protein